MNKPITIVRQDYMQQIVSITNECQLPAVFKADVLEAAVRKLREVADKELKRDMESYQAETQRESEPQEQQEPFTGVVRMNG